MVYRCTKCGRESGPEEVFVPISKSYEIVKKFHCPECSENYSVINGESYLIACIAVLIAGSVWAFFYPHNDMAWLTFEAGLAASLLGLAALAHEIGHILAAFTMGHKVFQVTIGFGRQLYKRDFLGMQWQFSRDPHLRIHYSRNNSEIFI